MVRKRKKNFKTFIMNPLKKGEKKAKKVCLVSIDNFSYDAKWIQL